jgi:hypothetical protein
VLLTRRLKDPRVECVCGHLTIVPIPSSVKISSSNT